MFKLSFKVFLFLLIIVTFGVAKCSFAAVEYVTLIKVLENDDQGIIERRNGERWLIEKGTGAISFWRFEGKKILINSPGSFCGSGSTIILPDADQEARIWDAEELDYDGFPSINLPTPSTSSAELIMQALALLGYYNPNVSDTLKSNILLALKVFCEKNNLNQSKDVSPDILLALSESVIKYEPADEKTLALASALLESAKQLLRPPNNQKLRTNLPETDEIIESQIDGDFEGWEGETIVKLVDGQIWQQTDYSYSYHYAFMPKVIIYNSSGQWKMKVEDMDESVNVERLK